MCLKMRSNQLLIAELNKVNIFEVDNQKCNNIIERFDEILCQKASKISLEELDNKFKYYLSKIEFSRYQEQASDLEKQYTQHFENLSKKMASFKREAKLKLTTTIQSIAKESKDQILSSLGGKPVEPEELKNLLKLKADKDDLFKVENIKADK